MKKCILILWLTALLLMVIGCGQKGEIDYSYSHEELVALQVPVLELINSEGRFAAHGCGTHTNAQGYDTLSVDGNYEPDVDYEAYKWHIRQVIGANVPIEFTLTPFPDTATIEGRIHEIEPRSPSETHILLVSEVDKLPNGDPNAMEITLTEATVIVDSEGHAFDLSDLKVGMAAASYYRGITLSSYPGQQGCERLVVNQAASPIFLEDAVNETLYSNKYKGEDLMGPFPIIGKGWRRQTLVDDRRLRLVELSISDGSEYYKETFSVYDSYSYEGEMLVYVRDAQTMTSNPFNIGSTYISEDFDPIYKDYNDDGLLDFKIPFYKDNRWVDQLYSITEDGAIFSSDGDPALKSDLAQYLWDQGYGIYKDLGVTDAYVLNKDHLRTMPYSTIWGLQTIDPESYLNKKITHYGFMVSNHALSGMSPQNRCSVWLMVCEGEIIGGYSFPDTEQALYGSVYALDGSTLEQVNGLDYETWLNQWLEAIEQMARPRADQLTAKEIVDKNDYGKFMYPLFASIPEEEIYLYEDYKGALLKYGDQVQHFPWLLTTPRFILPRLHLMDMDNDGVDELICMTNVGSGTGVSVDALHVLTYEEGHYVDHAFEDGIDQLEKTFSWQWLDQDQSLKLSLQNQSYEIMATDEMVAYGVEDLKANSAIIQYEFQDGQVIMRTPVVALSEDVPMGLYTFYWFRGVVDFDGEDILIEEMTIEKEAL